MAFSKRIVIERNSNPDELACAGSISGETEDGRRWILFLDAQGQPEVYWPKRAEDGAVIGSGMKLRPEYHDTREDLRREKLRSILDCGTPEDAVTRLRAALDTVEAYERGEKPIEEIDAIKAAGQMLEDRIKERLA